MDSVLYKYIVRRKGGREKGWEFSVGKGVLRIKNIKGLVLVDMYINIYVTLDTYKYDTRRD